MTEGVMAITTKEYNELKAKIERLQAHNNVLCDNQHDYVRYCTRIHELEAEIERLQARYDSATDQAMRYAADNERMRAEVEEWKERWAAERRDHEATMKAFDKAIEEY